jgi:hypothetical protein
MCRETAPKAIVRNKDISMEGRVMRNDDADRSSDRRDKFGSRKDPRLEGLISDWKKGEKDKWRGHGKKDVKKKK